jgi:hypothetical protein
MSVYLYINAALYAVFAVWCTLKPVNTAMSIGYASLTNGGRSEYLVIYGGLQAGLTVMYFLLARDAAFHRLGILISIGLYAPIVLYRVVTVWKFSPVATLTLATGALEVSLLVAAIWLAISSARVSW